MIKEAESELALFEVEKKRKKKVTAVHLIPDNQGIVVADKNMIELGCSLHTKLYASGKTFFLEIVRISHH